MGELTTNDGVRCSTYHNCGDGGRTFSFFSSLLKNVFGPDTGFFTYCFPASPCDKGALASRIARASHYTGYLPCYLTTTGFGTYAFIYCLPIVGHDTYAFVYCIDRYGGR